MSSEKKLFLYLINEKINIAECDAELLIKNLSEVHELTFAKGIKHGLEVAKNLFEKYSLESSD